MENKKPMKFADWLDEVGIPECARLLKVREGTIYHWRRGYSVPGFEQQALIVKYSRGRVSLEAIREPREIALKKKLPTAKKEN